MLVLRCRFLPSRLADQRRSQASGKTLFSISFEDSWDHHSWKGPWIWPPSVFIRGVYLSQVRAAPQHGGMPTLW